MHRTEWMRCKVVLTSCNHTNLTSPVVWILSRNVDFSPGRVLLHGLLKLLGERILDDQWLNIFIEGKVLDLNSVAAASHVELLVHGFHFFPEKVNLLIGEARRPQEGTLRRQAVSPSGDAG